MCERAVLTNRPLTALSCPCRCAVHIRATDTSLGVSGRHGFCVRAEIVRPRAICAAATRHVDRIQRVSVRDDREAPLLRVRDGADDACDLGAESSLFLEIRISSLRQIGAARSLRMARMQDSLVGCIWHQNDASARSSN